MHIVALPLQRIERAVTITKISTLIDRVGHRRPGRPTALVHSRSGNAWGQTVDRDSRSYVDWIGVGGVDRVLEGGVVEQRPGGELGGRVGGVLFIQAFFDSSYAQHAGADVG